jgi:hypothetical protein
VDPGVPGPLGWYLRLVLHYVGRGPFLVAEDGELLCRLTQHGPSSGVAVDEESATRMRAAARGCPVHLGAGSVPSGAFRGIVAVDVLARGGDDPATVAQWTRILAPGGRAIALVPDPAGRGHALTRGDWSGERPGNRSHEQWRTLFTNAGLRVHREGSDGLTRGPYGRIPALLDPRTAPARTQRSLGTLFLNPGEGENAVFVLEKPAPS